MRRLGLISRGCLIQTRLVQGVVNDELPVGGRLFRLRVSEERVSLAAIGVYPLDQGAVVARSAAAFK